MLSQSYLELFKRDIPRIKKEIEAFSQEQLIWKVADGTSNSAGNLALHLSGNLQHFIGAVLGDSGYIRDREFEFSGRVSRQELLAELDATLISVITTLGSLTDTHMKEPYPASPFDKEVTVEWFVSHLYGHLNYHLGQINYHRRMLDK